jgi:hypothetical protein
MEPIIQQFIYPDLSVSNYHIVCCCTKKKKKKNKNQFQIKPSMNLSNPQVKSILASTLGQA